MNKNQVKDLDTLEEYYNKCRKIKFKSFEPKSIEDLFFAVSSQFGSDCDNSTVYRTGTHHCYKGRHRSVCDYIKLSKFYYPEKSVKEILNVIQDNMHKVNPYNKGYGSYVRLGYCNVIRKNNFFSENNHHQYSKDYFRDINFYDNGFIFFNKRIKDII